MSNIFLKLFYYFNLNLVLLPDTKWQFIKIDMGLVTTCFMPKGKNREKRPLEGLLGSLQKKAGIRLRRPLENLRNSSLLNNFTVLHDNHRISDVFYNCQVMAYENICEL